MTYSSKPLLKFNQSLLCTQTECAGLDRYKSVLTTSLIFTRERPEVMKRMQRLGAQPTTRLLTALILR